MSGCEQIDWLQIAGFVLLSVGAFFVFAFVMLMLTCWFWKFVTWLNEEHGWFQ